MAELVLNMDPFRRQLSVTEARPKPWWRRSRPQEGGCAHVEHREGRRCPPPRNRVSRPVGQECSLGFPKHNSSEIRTWSRPRWTWSLKLNGKPMLRVDLLRVRTWHCFSSQNCTRETDLELQTNAQGGVVMEDGAPVAAKPVNGRIRRKPFCKPCFEKNVFFSCSPCSSESSPGWRSSAFDLRLAGAVCIYWDRARCSPRREFCWRRRLAGLVIAALVIHFFPQSRGSGVNQTKAALYHLQRKHSNSDGHRQIHYGCAGHRIGAFPGPGRSIAADRGLPGFGARSADAYFAGSNAPDCPGGRSRRIGGGI